MKTLILAVGLLAVPAQAEVIECPVKHQEARLAGAGMYEGEQKEAELMGAPTRVPGGIDAEFGFNRSDVKWLACQYEGKVVRWFRVRAEVTRCDLEKREAARGKVTAKLRCK